MITCTADEVRSILTRDDAIACAMHRYGLSDLVADHGGLVVFISEVAEAISSRGP
jgi:hypothetical protein